VTRPLDVWPKDVVEDLALVAIDLLCEPPERIDKYTGATGVSPRTVRRGREILDGANIDWRKLKEGAA
jgi:hypothetical protein